MRTSPIAVALFVLSSASHLVAATSGAVISISPTSYTIAENAGPVPLVHVVRTGDVTTSCSVLYAITGDGVVHASSQYLAFAPYQTSQTITVTPADDSQYTGPRSGTVFLDDQTVNGAAVGYRSATITVQDDEPLPAINVADITITEGNSGARTAIFTATMTPARAVPVSFNWSTQSGTAGAGSDYQQGNGGGTFAPGETSETFTVEIVGDSLPEADEWFRVNLFSNDPSVSIRAYAICTIIDDDPFDAPVADSLTPRVGTTAGGTDVTVRGSNFFAPCTVSMGDGTPITANVVSSLELTFKTPPHEIGYADLALTCAGKSKTKRNAFQFTSTPAPNLAPASGSTAGETFFRVLDDTGIASDCGVFFDDVAARGVKPESPIALIGVTPPHAAGSANVTLRCNGAASRATDQPFTFVAGGDPAPAVTDVSPNISRPGIDVRIHGAHFRPGDVVLFGVTAAPVYAISPDTVLVHIPDLPADSYAISVLEPGGRMSSPGVAFTMLETSPPRIYTITPVGGPPGSLINIEGLDFSDVNTLALDTTPLQTVSTSAGAYATVRVPPGFAPGSYTVTLLDALHRTLASGPKFTVTATTVAIDSIAQGCATSNGGTTVEVHGSGFTNGLPLFIGHVPATNVTVVDASTIRATAPAGDVGSADVSIRLADGTFVVLPGAFRYVSPFDADGGCCAMRFRPAHR